MMFFIDKFGQKTKQHRIKAGFTQAELAEKLNLSAKFLGQIETGVKIPSTNTILSLLNFFNLSLNEYLENEVIEHNCISNSILKDLNLIKLDEQDESFLLKLAMIINNKEKT